MKTTSASAAMVLAFQALVFWVFNSLLFSVVGFGIIPFILVSMIPDAVHGYVPWDFVVFGLLLIAVPVVSVYIALARFASSPSHWIRIFYGVEGPLFVLALFRMIAVRELTPATALVFAVAGISSAHYLSDLLRGPRKTWGLSLIDLMTGTAALGGALYCAALLSFYVPPAAAGLIETLADVFSSSFRESVPMLLVQLYAGLWFLLFVLATATLLALPPAMIVLHVGSFRRAFENACRCAGQIRATAVAAGTLAVLVVAFVAAQQKPSAETTARLRLTPQSDAERQDLLADEIAIEKGLLQAYLAPYRYLAGDDELGIAKLYEAELELSSEEARGVELAFAAVAAPFVYDGPKLSGDREEARDQYQAFFDAPLQKRDRKAVLHAVLSTWQARDRAASLLDVDERRVRLLYHRIAVEELGDSAEIEIAEAYVNESPDQQEVFYYFSLPASAVATGLWLGTTPDKSKADRFVVSARGAAQQIYREEVHRRQDPALLEQIGPGQYRLRVFPIPARSVDGPGVYLWLQYQTPFLAGGWPLPQLAEKRNVFWNGDTEVLPKGAEPWGRANLPALASTSAVGPQPHALRLDAERILWAEPLAAAPSEVPKSRRFALVLDRSRSMEPHRQELRREIQWIAENIAPHNDLDWYLTAAPSRGEDPSRLEGFASLDPERVIFYGGHPASLLLRQFAALAEDRTYDAVLVITDEGSLDLADDQEGPKDLGTALHMIHLGGAFPPGYDDATLETIQRHGGSAVGSAKEAFVAEAARHSSDPGFLGIVDGYRFSERRESTGPSERLDPFAKIAVRQLIMARLRTLDLGSATRFDELHALAQGYEIVTPFSSMIVLVNERQRERLKQLEKQEDRFVRESESGNEALSMPEPDPVVGTPEPQEWLLLLLVAVALIWQVRKRRDIVSLVQNSA